jgi:hypothetical protein
MQDEASLMTTTLDSPPITAHAGEKAIAMTFTMILTVHAAAGTTIGTIALTLPPMRKDLGVGGIGQTGALAVEPVEVAETTVVKGTIPTT